MGQFQFKTASSAVQSAGTTGVLRSPLWRSIFLVTALLSITAIDGVPAARAAAPSTNQPPASVYDLSVLPPFTGTVSQYLPSPTGGVTGLVLTDGTEILTTPALADSLPRIAKPGEKISGSGLKGTTLPLIHAFTITGPHGSSVQDTGIGMPHGSPEMMAGPDLAVQGVVWIRLYDVSGALSGAVLKDRTVLRLSPKGAITVADLLTPGRAVHAIGPGTSGVLGTAISVREIGPDGDHLTAVAADNIPPAGNPPGSDGYDIIPAAETH